MILTIDVAPGYLRNAESLGSSVGVPRLVGYLRRYLYDQQNPNSDIVGMDAALGNCPAWNPRTAVTVFSSAVATYYAPSDISGTGGMHRERIRATTKWHGDDLGRYDCVFIGTGQALGFRHLHAARVRLFFSFKLGGQIHSCALVQWFIPRGDAPDENVGMWVVEPETDASGQRVMSVIPLDSILRCAHLIPVYGTSKVPLGFRSSQSLHAFRAFYVNKFADHHSFELAF